MTAQCLLPVLRNADADEAVHRTTALLAAGCRTVELTTSTPGWAEAVARTVPLADAHGRPALIGVGTVTTAAQAGAALDAGAAFLISPYPAPEARAVAQRRGAVFVEGASPRARSPPPSHARAPPRSSRPTSAARSSSAPSPRSSPGRCSYRPAASDPPRFRSGSPPGRPP